MNLRTIIDIYEAQSPILVSVLVSQMTGLINITPIAVNIVHKSLSNLEIRYSMSPIALLTHVPVHILEPVDPPLELDQIRRLVLNSQVDRRLSLVDDDRKPVLVQRGNITDHSSPEHGMGGLELTLVYVSGEGHNWPADVEVVGEGEDCHKEVAEGKRHVVEQLNRLLGKISRASIREQDLADILKLPGHVGMDQSDL